jgi:uncharacterized HAD superfamily protein
MNMLKVVGIDIDGVISDIAGHITQFAREMYGCVITPESITAENLETCSDLSYDQVREIFSTSRFFKTLPILPKAKESLAQLTSEGWHIALMTDRFWYSDIQRDTLNWLRVNEIPFDSLYYVNKREKALHSRDLNIKLFIEDQLSNANLLSAVCERVILIDRSYNQGPAKPAVTRVSDIDEAVDALRSYISECTHVKRKTSTSNLESSAITLSKMV